MKKIILLILLSMGLFPYFENNSFRISASEVAAQMGFGEESGGESGVCVGSHSHFEDREDGSVWEVTCNYSGDCETGERFDEECSDEMVFPPTNGECDPSDPYGECYDDGGGGCDPNDPYGECYNGGSGGGPGGGGSGGIQNLYQGVLPIGHSVHTLSGYQESMLGCNVPPYPDEQLGFDFIERNEHRDALGSTWTTSTDLRLLSEDQLYEKVKDLFTSTSTGDLETVALDMLNHFKNGHGATYSNAILTNAVASNSAFKDWSTKIIDDFISNVRYYNNNINEATTANNFSNLPSLSFNSLSDKVTGLGITVHQVYDANAYLTNLTYDNTTRTYTGTMNFRLRDDFGLDRPDVQVHGNDQMPYGAGGAFKSWYLLQRYRCGNDLYKSFETRVNISVQFETH